MTVRVLCGDSRDLLRELPDDSLDSCACDPPYELGFMGRAWDSSGVAYDVELWREVFRVLKPGAHLAAFGGTRTFHRMAVAIEDAGFEIRDQLAWTYGSGFPKSLDVSKAIDKAAGVDREVVGFDQSKFRPNRDKHLLSGLPGGGGKLKADNGATLTAPATPEAEQWQGWGTALKPAWEPICFARKPLIGTVAANVLAFGTGAINVDGCRVGTETITQIRTAQKGWRESEGRSDIPPSADNSQTTTTGRFPANIVHDGSDEVLAGFPETGKGQIGGCNDPNGSMGYHGGGGGRNDRGSADSGSAARYFYSAKAGKLDRLGSDHPTVKPVDLMRWLVRLITPPGGTVLDPFAGTGSTGIAAHIEGFDAIMMELRPEAAADIERRLAHIKGEGRTTAIEQARLNRPDAAHKARGGDLPLFAEPDQ